MTFLRKKEIPPHSGNYYYYEVKTTHVNGKVLQKVVKYWGKNWKGFIPKPPKYKPELVNVVKEMIKNGLDSSLIINIVQQKFNTELSRETIRYWSKEII